MSLRHPLNKSGGESPQQQENNNTNNSQSPASLLRQDVHNNNNNNNGNPPTTAVTLSSSYQPDSTARRQFTRSHPIAIRRNKGGLFDSSNNAARRAAVDTSDEEDEFEDDYDSTAANVERDAVRLGLVDSSSSSSSLQRRNELTSHSLPSRLLRAPLLGSVPTNEDYLLYRDIPTATLPPPMAMNDQPPLLSGVVMTAEHTTSYGSLRESNQKGRFLDGPSSYRDSRTGDIRRTEQRVRFEKQAHNNNNENHEQQQGDSSNLSIRDRMKQARERNTTKKAAEKKPTSSLAAMFDDANQNNTNTSGFSAATPASFHDFSSPFYANHISALPSGALSTSLTGLEMLQRGLRLATITDHDSHLSAESSSVAGATSSDQLPRDANGHNALLSRSLSDPRGTGRRLAETQQRSPVLPTYPQQAQPQQFLPPLALGGTFLSPTGGLVSHLSVALSHQQQEPETLSLTSLSLQQQQTRQQAPFDTAEARADADLEGAFEMDME